ncbi:LpxL/LpxP family acyltransferase, partial [Mycobacterium avium]
MPAGPAKLAVASGAALLPVHVHFEGEGWRFLIYPALDCSSGDVGAITQVLADHFEKNIAAHPEDWHMMQPQWLADLPDSTRARLRDS